MKMRIGIDLNYVNKTELEQIINPSRFKNCVFRFFSISYS